MKNEVHCLISAGPTREWLDPVRFISNPSSGKMGYALANAAKARGFKGNFGKWTGNTALPYRSGSNHGKYRCRNKRSYGASFPSLFLNHYDCCGV